MKQRSRFYYYLASILWIGLTSTSLFANSLSEIQSKGVIRVAIFGKSSPPFLVKKGSEWAGLDIDLAHSLAKHLGVQLELVDKARSFDQVVDLVSKGKDADIALSKLSITSSRARKVLYSQPYVKLKLGIVYNRLKFSGWKHKDNGEHSFNQTNLKVGALKASSYVDFVDQRFPKAQKVYFENRDDIYQAVAKGDIDFCLSDEVVIEAWKRDYPALGIKNSTYMLENSFDPIGAITAVDQYHLKEWLNVFILQIENSGELNSLRKKYFESDSWR